MRNNPHILEINARSWLARYEREQGRKFTLADVPAAFWEKIQEAGFDAVWLMGVWKLSTVAEKIARENEEILNQVRTSKPNFKTEDIAASPYAVYDYTVDEFFGGNEALAAFRKNLNDRGIQLFLDFVGNHTAIDAPVVEEHPELFVTTGTKAPHVHEDWFFQNKKGHYIAHGRDPYFAPWTDTAQLNYFNPKTRDFMTKKLLEVSRMCDGVRCDMAMLSLNKVQRDTWWEFIGGELPKEEFWTQALNAVRAEHPEFVFIAEVYWGLEWDIQELGFDYTYDNVLYDRLRFANAESIRALQKEYASDIHILLGFETEYYPETFDKLIEFVKPLHLDYMIMGQHFVGNEYDEGSYYVAGKGKKEDYLAQYVAQVKEGLSTGAFTYLAHPDTVWYEGDPDFYIEQMTDLCRFAKAHDIPLEYNILGYFNKRCYPNPTFWDIVAKTGAKAVIGYDAHTPEALLDHKTYRECEQNLLKRGITPATIDEINLRGIK